ncbi:hypothetical protein A4D02_33690 [Niastella koreensis]|uniref:Lipoprotein n=2 Tax=Niastella koreensis TaxID=354356 RepID=G8TAI4_NIAKG|nr:hypothetical protein [Niastella koreensis]AEV98146.1 hypothetical protein Niako_1783 [Niastella koreensis GR20-10]OQP45352.1 hypothetical protein A4D02_33690 [Niastella koreensis]
MPRSCLFYPQVLQIIVFLAACAHKPKATYPEALLWDQQVDTSLIAVIPYTRELFSGENKGNNTAATLTKDDMKRIEFLLTNCVQNNKDIDLKNGKYKRQYVAVTNDKGEKIVWVNCFCHVDGFDWKKSIVMVSDGGSCYFNVEINLTRGEYNGFWVNGYA